MNNYISLFEPKKPSYLVMKYPDQEDVNMTGF
jgi:hypothetical protein